MAAFDRNACPASVGSAGRFHRNAQTIPAINGFTQRVAAQGFKKHRDREGRYFLGMVIATARCSVFTDGSADILQ